MVRPDVIASHVEALLERMLDTDHVVPDAPGQWSVRNGSALYTVRVKDAERPHVEVFAVVVEGVRPTKALYERLNDYNARASHGRWFLEGDKVVVAGELVGETLDVEELTCTCSEVGYGADHGGQALQAEFGGIVRFPPEQAAEDVPNEHTITEAPNGGYL
jgi:hypothetical protein